MKKDFKTLRREYEAKGWTIARTSGGSHTMWRHPSGKGQVTVAGTPSDWRSFHNTVADLKRVEKTYGNGKGVK